MGAKNIWISRMQAVVAATRWWSPEAAQMRRERCVGKSQHIHPPRSRSQPPQKNCQQPKQLLSICFIPNHHHRSYYPLPKSRHLFRCTLPRRRE